MLNFSANRLMEEAKFYKTEVLKEHTASTFRVLEYK
jgi:hypothetical protein